MIDKRTNLQCYLVLIFVKLLEAQEVPNTSSNQGSSTNSLQPRFSDRGAMGSPNFGSGRFGNPTSNYPTDSRFPYGNQNNNIQWPQQGSGSYPNQGNFQNRQQGYPTQQGYPNSQGYPYQGDSMNPSPNYQRRQYPNQNIQNRPVQGGYPNPDAYLYQGDINTRYPNYQRPSYPKSPNDGLITYPDDKSRPYQNGGLPTNQGGPGQSFQYPVQDNQYPSQRNFQGNGNPHDMNLSFRPDDLGNLPNTNIDFPDGRNQYRPNQYYPQTNSQNQNYRPVQGQLGNYPLNYNPDTNIQFPTNYQGGTNVDSSAIQYPNQGIPNPGGSGNVLPDPSVNPDFNNAFQNQRQLPNNHGNIPN